MIKGLLWKGGNSFMRTTCICLCSVFATTALLCMIGYLTNKFKPVRITEDMIESDEICILCIQPMEKKEISKPKINVVKPKKK